MYVVWILSYPKESFFWSIHFDINWCKAWMVHFQYCISNKIRGLNFIILHNIYTSNKNYQCLQTWRKIVPFVILSWKLYYNYFVTVLYHLSFGDIEKFIMTKSKHTIQIRPMDILGKFECKNKVLTFIINNVLFTEMLYAYSMALQKFCFLHYKVN